MIDSLIRIMYFVLLANNCARAVADTGLVTALMAVCLRGSRTFPELEHRDLMTLTNTRAPSLLTGTESERRDKVKIWLRHEEDS